MQYLKEDVRQHILEAAVEEFVLRGFKNASLRRIAEKAGITAGNIYRYFENKDELLSECLQPLIKTLEGLISQNIQFVGDQEIDTIMRNVLAKSITQIYRSFPREFSIMRHGLKDTMYNAYYENLLVSVTQKIRSVTPWFNETLDPMIFEILARNQFNAILHILDHADDEDVEKLIGQYFSVALRVFESV